MWFVLTYVLIMILMSHLRDQTRILSDGLQRELSFNMVNKPDLYQFGLSYQFIFIRSEWKILLIPTQLISYFP
jgi:hypothetical protein